MRGAGEADFYRGRVNPALFWGGGGLGAKGDTSFGGDCRILGIIRYLDVPRRPLSKDTRGFSRGRNTPDVPDSAGHPLYLVCVSN